MHFSVKQTTLVYVFNPQWQILLAAKKKTNSGFNISLGKWNGAGGKVEEDETYLQSAKRELEEETGICIDESKFIHMGIIHFSFATKKEWDQECHVFVVKDYTGAFHETEEMKPQWFDTTTLPYDDMRADDKYRLPRLLNNEKLEYMFHFSDEGDILSYERLL